MNKIIIILAIFFIFISIIVWFARKCSPQEGKPYSKMNARQLRRYRRI